METPITTTTSPEEETTPEISAETQQPPVASSASTSTSTTRDRSFRGTFDEFFQKYLETDASEMNDRDIRAFTVQIPITFVVSEDRYPILFKVLFKIKKEIKNKAVYNDSLALIEKLFTTLDFNKFLLQFWNSDVFKERELGPIGYSFTDGKARYDFSDVRPTDDINTKNAKVVEAAWSMLLDVDATVEALLHAHCNDRAMSIFYVILLRRFKCLGDYKIKLDGKDTPIFFYFFRRLYDQALQTGHLLSTLLSCLVSVTWTPKSSLYCWSLMKPNYALCEIMDYLIRDDANQSKYLQSLNRLFNPFEHFYCKIQWNSQSTNFDNPTLFIIHFCKYYNRKNSIEFNNAIYDIIVCFKKSLRECGEKITNLEMLEESFEIDWPFAYSILEYLEVQTFKRQISESIFSALPANVAEKCVPLNDGEEPSLEKALTGIMELFFLCGSSNSVPDAFFKNLLATYGCPKSVVDTFAKCIIGAYNNLKSSAVIKADVKLIEFVARICEYSLDSNIFQQFSSMVEIDTDLIHQNLHFVIIGRVIRSEFEEIYYQHNRKPSFSEMDIFFQDLFNIYAAKVHRKFGELRTENRGTWPPWRKGGSPVMSDKISMGINHVLNAIQKEIFCIFDTSSGRNEELLELLIRLYKERRYFGLTFSKLDAILRNNFPSYFEQLDAADADRQNEMSNVRGGNNSEYYRQPPRDERSMQPRYDQQGDRQLPPEDYQSQNGRSNQQQRYDQSPPRYEQNFENHRETSPPGYSSQNGRSSPTNFPPRQSSPYEQQNSDQHRPPQDYQPSNNRPTPPSGYNPQYAPPPEAYQQRQNDDRPAPPQGYQAQDNHQSPQGYHQQNNDRSSQQPRYDQQQTCSQNRNNGYSGYGQGGGNNTRGNSSNENFQRNGNNRRFSNRSNDNGPRRW